jgi:hypothetical protein
VNAALAAHRHHRLPLVDAAQTGAANTRGAAGSAPSSSISAGASPPLSGLAVQEDPGVPPNQVVSAAPQQTPAAHDAAATTDASSDALAAGAVSTDSIAAASTKPGRGTLAPSNSTKSLAPNGTRGTGLTAWQKAAGSAQTATEKFADRGSRQNGSGGDSSNHSAKNDILDPDSKQVTNSATKVGTDTAIGRAPMTSNLHASANLAATSDVFATVSSSAASTTAGTHAIAVSHAAGLVHQINEIGEGLWRVDRQSVEVNFNFGDKDHLSVRVEYKDGQVQATFNTSSTELRTAITQAWNSQNSSSNDRSYKMAEPIFNNSSNASFSSSDDASSNSRQFASFQDVTNFAGSSRSRSSSASTVSAPAPSSPRSSLRPEVAGHLNAIV